MDKKIFILLLILALSSSVHALDASHHQETTLNTLLNLKTKAFPELAQSEIRLQTFQENDAYFQSNFDFWTLFGTEPIYIIEMNPELIQRGCPEEAVEAILAHELSHTLDYVQGGIPKIIQIGWDYLSVDKRAIYEHRTDLNAIFRGYGSGLIQYREWIYAQLTPEQLKLKKHLYYQPQEIHEIQKRIQSLKPDEQLALERIWLNQPPMNIQEIKAPL